MASGKTIVLAALAVVIVAAALLLLNLDRRPSTETSTDAATIKPGPAIPAGPAPPSRESAGPVDLGSILAFSSQCEIGEPLAAIFTAMVKIDQETWEASAGDPVSVPGFDRPIATTFKRTISPSGQRDGERHVVAGLPLSGIWHGLRVNGLRLDFYEESDVSSREIHFEEPPERVREALGAAGFDLSPVGAYREMEGEGMVPSIGVDRDGSGAALICTTG